MKRYLLVLLSGLSCFGLPLTPGNIPQVFTSSTLSNGPLSVVSGNVNTAGNINAASLNFVGNLNGIASNVVQRISGLSSDAQTQITANGAAISVAVAGLVTTSNRVETVNTLMAAATNAINTSLSGKQDSFTTGRGITNNSGTLSNNIAAGSNITLTTGANGVITIASTASGGGGTVGTLINTASTTAGQLVQFSDNQKTNTTPVSTGFGITNNASVLSNNIVAGNGITLTAGSSGQITIADTSLRLYGHQTSVSNTASPVTIFSQTVPGGTLGTNKMIVFMSSGVLSNSSGGTATINFTVTYGGTQIFGSTSATFTSQVTARSCNVIIRIANVDSTAVQACYGSLEISANGSGTGGGGFSTADTLNSSKGEYPFTVDSTADQTLAVTATLSAADANIWYLQKLSSVRN